MIDPNELERLSKAATAPGTLIADKGAFLVALETAYRTGQLVPAQPSGDEVEAVAINLVNRQRIFEGYEPLKDLTPLDNEDQEFWRNEATAAITALDAVRGKQ